MTTRSAVSWRMLARCYRRCRHSATAIDDVQTLALCMMGQSMRNSAVRVANTCTGLYRHPSDRVPTDCAARGVCIA